MLTLAKQAMEEVTIAIQSVTCVLCGGHCGKLGETLVLRRGASVEDTGHVLCGQACRDELALRFRACDT